MRLRARGEDIRRYIIENVEKHSMDISRVTAEKFEITRQAVNKHLQKLVAENVLVESGKTRSRTYKLVQLTEWNGHYQITPDLAEDVIWRNDIAKAIGLVPENVIEIWHYAFTEMFNNAIDHANAALILVAIKKNAADTVMTIYDNGVGVFKKIQKALNLLDEHHAVLELSKGKLTTDPKRHSGEGIFFTSRMVDRFSILSGKVYLSHNYGHDQDWVMDDGESADKGTMVYMRLHNHTSRTLKKVFDQFTSGDNYGFNKTIIPVELAQYGDDKLISRSQAKRLLARVDQFKSVIFDFKGVESIGQAFSDEIFRVFAQSHPGTELFSMNANSQIKRMIERAKSGTAAGVHPTS